MRLGRDGPRSSVSGSKDAPTTVTLAVVTIGPHKLAIEASRVIEVRAGALFTGCTRADLHALLGAEAKQGFTVIARGDSKSGRGPGPRVGFGVDDCDRLVVAQLEAFAPLPPVAREQIQVDFLVGVVRIGAKTKIVEGTRPTPARAASGGRRRPGEDVLAFLLDPIRLLQTVTGDAPGEGRR
jgi:hypothetical protein